MMSMLFWRPVSCQFRVGCLAVSVVRWLISGCCRGFSGSVGFISWFSCGLFILVVLFFGVYCF